MSAPADLKAAPGVALGRRLAQVAGLDEALVRAELSARYPHDRAAVDRGVTEWRRAHDPSAALPPARRDLE